ncbi:glycoside hydrolase family 26 protein [Spongisporangium articulatum]|uniref:Glycoside hydrolase family 26 protein n=1 Tax=Spongisporangium articulatum TaxID=3362603 RepID=A0ABW8AL43_9ACTN
MREVSHGPVRPDDVPLFVGHPRRSRRRPRLLVPLLSMALLAGAVAVANVKLLPAYLAGRQCRVDDLRGVVPADGALVGVDLDWKHSTLARHRQALGHAPAVAVEFASVPIPDGDRARIDSAAAQVRRNGGVLLLTLEPGGGLDTMTDPVIAQLVRELAQLNRRGVPVVLRFAHEMNGSWYAWGQQPRRYVQVFRRVAQAVHAQAPGTAMMWAPSYGGGYPFRSTYTPKRGTRDYRDLDTNGDGRLTMADDMYAPFYPGDDVVDWVGLSAYHWGNRYPWGENEVPEPGRFAAMLSGTYQGSIGDERKVPDFYRVYGVVHGKPVGIPETAAFYAPGRSGASESAIKRAWWRQVFSGQVHQRYPQVKMINWFEIRKYETEVDEVVDWRFDASPALAASFRADLPGWARYADAVKACD